ncbi:sulfite exporter TauE/SafE family protein [Saccharopolyspora sp. NPDC049357]|uniref:sulfite exporter TauE/SafE family protein n=1 Tax=Saccharopolyspora sp. NPDC049357 TaxID=3154507 RepID=UPI00341D3BF6
MTLILLGLLSTAAAALLGGLTGFGYALLASPLLLLIGLPPAQVVAVNLLLALFTRITVVARWWSHIIWSRALVLTLSSVPGLAIGLLIVERVDQSVLRWTTGVLALVAAPLLMISRPRQGQLHRGFYALAGLLGGAFATTTSLNGVPPALTLASDGGARRSLVVDMAFYFVVSNVVGIVLMVLSGGISDGALELVGLWLPGCLIGNWAGTRLAPHVPATAFRYLVCVLVVAAGISTLASG